MTKQKTKSKRQKDKHQEGMNLIIRLFVLVIVILVFLLLVAGIIIIPLEIYKKLHREKTIEPLTPKQLTRLLELGIIELHKDLPHNSRDVFSEVVFGGNEKLCYIYQDIFGRYYCRWED